MSALPPTHDLKCDCREKALRRLAPLFREPCWAGGRGGSYAADDAANVLLIDERDVVALCNAGVLDGEPDGYGGYDVPTEELIRLLEEHGTWLWQLLLQKQIEALREQIRPREEASPTSAPAAPDAATAA